MPRLITARRLVPFVVACSISLLILVINRATVNDRWYVGAAPCEYTPEHQRDTLLALSQAHNALHRAGLTYFLCYGSLWGSLRTGSLLPTDRAADLCLLDETLQKLDENYLYRFFRDAGFTLSYDSPTGVYLAQFGTHGATITLTVFEKSLDEQWYQRVGMLSRLLPPQSKSRFPTRLVALPLEMRSIEGHDVSVDIPAPREDIEIQKYLYPDDWWKIVKPPGC